MLSADHYPLAIVVVLCLLVAGFAIGVGHLLAKREKVKKAIDAARIALHPDAGYKVIGGGKKGGISKRAPVLSVLNFWEGEGGAGIFIREIAAFFAHDPNDSIFTPVRDRLAVIGSFRATTTIFENGHFKMVIEEMSKALSTHPFAWHSFPRSIGLLTPAFETVNRFCETFVETFDERFTEEAAIIKAPVTVSSGGKTLKIVREEGTDNAVTEGALEFTGALTGEVVVNLNGDGRINGDDLRTLVDRINEDAKGLNVSVVFNPSGATGTGSDDALTAELVSFSNEDLILASLAASAGDPPNWFTPEYTVNLPDPLPAPPEPHSSIRVAWLNYRFEGDIDEFENRFEKDSSDHALALQFVERMRKYEQLRDRHDALTNEANKLREEERFFQWRRFFALRTAAALALFTSNDPETNCSDLSVED